MEGNMVRHAVLLMSLFVCMASHASPQRVDGNWWMHQSLDTKLGYVIGYQGGEETQYLICVTALNANHPACTDIDSIPHATNGQVVDAITQFYQDARNRTILTFHAVQLVAFGIRGVPAETIQQQTEAWRRMDSQVE